MRANLSKTLPVGWAKTTLGEIVEPLRERILPAELADDTRYVGLEHIEPQTMKLLGHENVRSIRSSSLRFVRGDVLYGKMRPYLNKVWLAEFDGICSAEFLVLPKSDRLSSGFLALRLNAEDFVQFANEQVSGERPRVGFEKLAHFPVLLPPFAEQQRIATKLGATLFRSQRAESAARRAEERLQRYGPSVLEAAVKGELTRSWREAQTKQETDTGKAHLSKLLAARRDHWEKAQLERLTAIGKVPKDEKWKAAYVGPKPTDANHLPKLPRNWTWASLDQLLLKLRNGISQAPRESDGLRILRISAVRAMRTDLTDVRYLPKASVEKYRDYELQEGDLLFIRYNGNRELAGVCAPVPRIHQIIVHPDKLIRGIPTQPDRLASTFIAMAANSGLSRKYIDEHLFTTAGQWGISGQNLKLTPIPLPSVGEQIVIVQEVERRLSAADRLAKELEEQLARARSTRESLLRDAFAGRLVPQDPNDEPAFFLLDRLRIEKAQRAAELKQMRREVKTEPGKRTTMRKSLPSSKSLSGAWERTGRIADARRLFDAAGFGSEHVVEFYEALRANPEMRNAFREVGQQTRRAKSPLKPQGKAQIPSKGRFRLVELWLEGFKNLKDYTVRFVPAYGLDVVLGWNGTGKSNLFEALVLIFRDLHEWWERNRWPDKSINGYRLSYEMDEHIVQISWLPAVMKRPELRSGPIVRNAGQDLDLKPIKREELPLPRFVFAYYSGPTNRLCEHFLPMEQAHYIRLRQARMDDAKTLARLLEQRRFFCAETHHAKYVLLAFSYKEDPKINKFLAERLRIIGFESALFVIRKPRWAKPGSKAEDFWGATGIMRRVMERLHRFAIAPMVLDQNVSDGYRSITEEHYYFFLPDLESLHSFAAEYQDARTFFLALESTDFSELIYDVKIQVRIKSTDTEDVAITFHQLSEGEQQLLMVLGLLRFTKSHQSLVLLDEPDTHLNPHWSVDYVKDLTRVMSDNALESPEQQTSQILMATHDPLVIASLVKEQIHLLKRDPLTGVCRWTTASVNPRGLGFTGILTSEMFGFRSDLDPETLADLDDRVRLVAKEEALTAQERQELKRIDVRLAQAGFDKAFSDPYYAAFVRAWGRRHSELMTDQQFLSEEKKQEIDRIAREVLDEAVAEVEKEIAN